MRYVLFLANIITIPPCTQTHTHAHSKAKQTKSRIRRVIRRDNWSVQPHILISSSDTADGVRTPDSVIIPEIKLGGYESKSVINEHSERLNVP